MKSIRQGGYPMETGTNKNRTGLTRLWWFLILVTALSAFCWLTLHVWLLPCSIAYQETGKMTAGYFLYAAIGLLFSTPGPFIAVLIISLFIEKTGVRQMFRSIFHTEDKLNFLPACAYLCAAVRKAQRFALVYAPAWFSDHDPVCRYCRGNRLARAASAGAG